MLCMLEIVRPDPFFRMMEVAVDRVGEGVEEEAVHPSGEVDPNGYLKVVAGVGHGMEGILGEGVRHILVPGFATEGVEQDQLAMAVVEGQLKTVGVGVGVVVHVLQTPGEGMVQDHLEGVGVEDHQADDEEAYPSLVPLEEAAVLVLPMAVQMSY